jgi:ABC-type transporter Mla subunit MlaD
MIPLAMNISAKRKMLLAAIAVVGFACLSLLLLKIPRYPLQIRTYLHGGQNLQTGSPVWIDGVTAGVITEVNVRPEYGNHPVEVVMKSDSHFRYSVPEDSVAVLSSQGVFAPTGLDIDTRNAHGKLIATGSTLKSEEVSENQVVNAMDKIGNILIDAAKDVKKSSHNSQ